MSKPRLTNRVMAGLMHMAALTEAGDCEVFTGYPNNAAHPEERQIWDDTMRACRWVWEMRDHRESSE